MNESHGKNLELEKRDKMKDSLIRDVSQESKAPFAKQAMYLEMLQVSPGEECSGKADRLPGVMGGCIGQQEGL